MPSTLLLTTALLAAGAGEADARVVDRVNALLAAETPAQAQEVARQIVEAGLPFDEVYRCLRAGRAVPGAETGVLERERRNRDGVRHRYLVIVPESYDPARRYPVAVYLHGGIVRPAWDRGGRWWRDPQRLLREDRIAVVPASWSASKWWQASQIENLEGILRELKREYSVDENRVVAIGISDGGTGTWYLGLRDTTPWAAFLPFISHPGVLANPDAGAEGALFVANLAAKPFLAINGGRDPLYPAAELERPIRALQGAGVPVEFVVVPEGGHDVRWWPERAGEIEAFIAAHPRDPLPDRVFWATDRTDRDNRAHWLVIDELDGEHPATDLEVLGAAPPHRGWVLASRRGNAIDVAAAGVRRYRLLLSPEELDLGEEITVTTGGRISFQGRVEPSLETLLQWAARDGDRTMLFAAELAVAIDPQPR